MEFWNDELRICPHCRHSFDLSEEARRPCPKCGKTVWFYNYRPISEPPDLPRLTPHGLFTNPATALLLIATILLALVALIGLFNGLLVATTSALIAIGFAAFAFLRHRETLHLEEKLSHAHRLQDYASLMRGRAAECTSRHNHLLRTGDARVEHYYSDIYARAVAEREQAARLRGDARRDRQAVAEVESWIHAIAERLIDDHRKWMTQKLRPDPENYQRRRRELEKAFDFVESVGYRLPKKLRESSHATLKAAYVEVVRLQQQRDEQRRLNQQMREEARLQEEAEREIAEAEATEQELELRLERALREHRDVYDAEVEELRRQLAEAHARAERAKSMAQLTRCGHVYVLSNIGSFGEGVYKVGMTRRLDPELRVHELGDASVPFPFDVHVMISCNDAPALEHALHQELTRHRVNRVNLRKEFFRVELDTIIDLIKQHHGEIEYIADPEALQYRETLSMTPDDVVQWEHELEAAGVTTEDLDE